MRTHFALSCMPFTREIDPRDRFTLPLFEEPLAHLQRAVENRQSAALIAPAGTGKTQVLRALQAALPEVVWCPANIIEMNIPVIWSML